ncbi:MAG: deoxyribose-phosphate aldolase [Anaerolineales bacterium]
MTTLSETLSLAAQYQQSLPAEYPPFPLPAPEEIPAWIDHTLLKPQATAGDIRILCAEARQSGFASVCVNPAWVPLASGELLGAAVKVCTVIGFPLGATFPAVKTFEAQSAIQAGATEIDMVINVGALKSADYETVWQDLTGVVQLAREYGALVKVILETALLTQEEKITACLLSKGAGADFVKTSTGFGPGGATAEDIALMRRVVGPKMGVKASGGVRTWRDMQAMVRAGATRIGASAGMSILEEARHA